MSSKDKKLAIVAVVCLVAAGLLIAWNQGWIFAGGGSSSTTPPPVQTDPSGQPTGGPRQAPPVG